MNNNILPRVCRECGATFQGGPRAWYCPECRAERKKIQTKEYKQRKKAGKTVPVGSLIKCEICGKEIVKSGGSQRFCSECAAKHLKEVDNQQSLEWKKSNPEKVRESKRKMSKARHATGESHESGVKGVTWDKGKKKWIVKINYKGKQYRIMQTSDMDEAIRAIEKTDAQIIALINQICNASYPQKGAKRIEEDNLNYRYADMSNLSETQRAYLLAYLDGMRAQDIAEMYGVKKPVVYNRIREAKRIIDTGSAHTPEELARRKEYSQKYYAQNKEKIRAYNAKYLDEHRESVRETRRKNHERNRTERLEKMHEYNKKYYQENRERILKNNSERRKSNK